MPVATGPVFPPDLLESVGRDGAGPKHEQIEIAIREAIRDGRLEAGTILPSTRSLAAELGLSRGVVTEAYSQLAAEGYLLTRQGAAVRVAGTVRPPAPVPEAQSMVERFQYDFRPGVPDLAGFPRDRWLRSLRAAWREAPIDAVGYPDPRGVPELRSSLAEYLGRVRGAVADPEQIVIYTGFSQAFSHLCRRLGSTGVERIAVEDPGWHLHRLIAEHAGLDVVPVPVDGAGIQVEELAASGASAVVVTPAHQFPTGALLGSERRAALVEWAERGENLIVEDDYDAEYRYDRSGVGALQGLAPDRVAYIGSASKRLVPGMRLGWALMPSWLGWQLVPEKSVEDGGSEVIGQLALHDFIERGELDRHLRRMRLVYRRRREALVSAVEREIAGAVVGDGNAGLFELVTLPAGASEGALAGAAAERGVGVEGLALHRFAAEGPPGLVLGFGALAEPAIERGLVLLGEAAQAVS